MGAESFEVLLAAAKRVLGVRLISLCGSGSEYNISVSVDEALKNDRYIITFTDGGAEIKAGNNCACHAAFGRFMLESVFDGRGDVKTKPAGTVIDFTPAKALRGMYFATHFHNFYHSAPMEKVQEVIEDIALRGCNSLLVWFDMHHYNSVEDPDAKEMIVRLREILSYAKKIGISPSMTSNANEGFNSSPEELRAEWHTQGKYKKNPVGHYHREICPSKPGGIEEIEKERREMLKCFADVGLEYIIYWPYDQGGCTCAQCEPWGANGFVKAFKAYKRAVNDIIPETKIIVSTWYFNKFIDGEWEGFYPLLGKAPFDDVPFIMSYFPRGNVPPCLIEFGAFDAGLNFIDFPEISMRYCTPWGGFGASVLTRFMKETNDKCAHLYNGGFPYSEGIFEDANKFIQLGSYTGLYPDAIEALRKYVRSEFCTDDEELFEAVLKTETALERDADYSKKPYRFEIKNTSDIDFVYETFEKYNKLLPENITNSRNFRLFYLRAVIDYELKNNDFEVKSTRCIEAMEELEHIYYVAAKTLGDVRPPIGDIKLEIG